MRKYKTICLLIGLSLSLMGVWGCMKNNEKNSIEEITSHLNEEYNDNFSFVSSGNELWNKEYTEIIYLSEKLNADIAVWVYPDGTILDNYMAVKYKSEVEEFVSPLAEEVYDSCIVVNIPIHYGKEHLNKDLSFSDYISNSKSDISISLATDRSDEFAEDDARKFVKVLSDNGMIAYIRVFYYDSIDFNKVKETEEASRIFSPLSEKCLTVRMDEDYSIDLLEWG